MINKKTRLLMVMSMLFLIILSACKETRSENFKIHFDTSGGPLIESITYNGKDSYPFPNDPTKEGYIFDGWYFDNDSFEDSYSEDKLINKKIKSDVTLYAKWVLYVNVLNELEQRISSFEAHGNQFKIEMTIDLDITIDNEAASFQESFVILTQLDSAYTLVTSGDYTIVTYQKDDVIYQYSINHHHLINGVKLYDRQTLSMESLKDPLSELEFDFNHVDVTKVSANEYKVSGKIIDFMPSSTTSDLKDIFMSSGISEEDFNDMTIELSFVFNDESITYQIHMEFNIDDIRLSMNIDAIFSHQNFEMIDFSDDSSYFPMSSYETEIPININKPIVFTADTYYISSYYTYIEAGRYGIYRNNLEVEGLTIQLFNQNRDLTKYRVFNDVYNRYHFNPDNITNFFEIPTDGYYFITIDYPVAPEPYIIEFRSIESETDGIETPTFVVTESGVFNYEIESMYDFVSFSFDLGSNALVSITDSKGNHIYLNNYGDTYFASIVIPPEGFNHYITASNSIFYIHNPKGPSKGTLTIVVTPLVHAISPDDSMLLMSDQFSHDYVMTDYELPIQYIGIEVTERKKYTFEFSMVSGSLNDVEGYLYHSDGTSFATIRHNDSVILMPGSYYYSSSNYNVSVYSIKAVKSDIVETSHHIDFLETYNQITGSPQLQPKISGTINYKNEFIVYYFTLAETKDIVFFQNNMFELYDSMSNRLDIVNLSNRFVYRLEAGDYFIVVTHPNYYTEDFFPFDYSLTLYIFNGGGEDTSVYPFFEVIPFGFEGKTATMDYSGDYDGYTFTLTKTTTVSIVSSYRAQLIKDNRIIYSSVENQEMTLEAGTYVIICSTYHPTWTVRVMIKN